jgi:hypothetical protein
VPRALDGSGDPGGHPIRTAGASRVLHPPRFGASGCSAEGRSATRPDPQRLHGRTRRAGQLAWGSKLGPLFALPMGKSAFGGGHGEERRRKLRPQPVRVWDGRCSRKAGRPSFFLPRRRLLGMRVSMTVRRTRSCVASRTITSQLVFRGSGMCRNLRPWSGSQSW